MAIMVMMPTDYIDLHCHLLPGLDDGPKTLTEAVLMARQAVADGIRYVLATPHHLDRRYHNEGPNIERAVVELQAELERQAIPLTIFAGQEVHLGDDLVDGNQKLLGIDKNKHYLLLELPHETVPDYLEQVVFELLNQGTIPVIAHPERNAQIMAQPTRLYELVRQGCLAQATAGSLTGNFGRQIKSTALELIRCGLIQVIATDAHLMPKREFLMNAGYQVLARLNSYYPEFFATNAKMLLNGEPLVAPRITVPRRKIKCSLW
ncbi:CpsB/CapC family capsule biosynthesis tyrosine phosphatase [Lactiplantibacillus sp. DA1]|uniref:tyrosine-protein phosphatase n=1 Tax=Lactiplantibacillus sp. DA1 TaxID=3079857 RepID=UPI00292A60D9|nr:CpsB/CapC family capsule biosynthesis tyrosine phosphatase [Lactiplantibacillus sp. DA1]MDV0430144.1 CpsB/CapC family capsule biosynthesis tyrosine phosphatase [Lactiplantibacillus sp. DA1]